MAKSKFYALIHPGAPKGVLRDKPRRRAQDKRAISAYGYVVVFFPKITGIGKAEMSWCSTERTLSQTPEAAIAKKMDGIAKGEKWETYHDAGWRVRRVRLTDLGDA